MHWMFQVFQTQGTTRRRRACCIASGILGGFCVEECCEDLSEGGAGPTVVGGSVRVSLTRSGCPPKCRNMLPARRISLPLLLTHLRLMHTTSAQHKPSAETNLVETSLALPSLQVAWLKREQNQMAIRPRRKPSHPIDAREWPKLRANELRTSPISRMTTAVTTMTTFTLAATRYDAAGSANRVGVLRGEPHAQHTISHTSATPPRPLMYSFHCWTFPCVNAANRPARWGRGAVRWSS